MVIGASINVSSEITGSEIEQFKSAIGFTSKLLTGVLSVVVSITGTSFAIFLQFLAFVAAAFNFAFEILSLTGFSSKISEEVSLITNCSEDVKFQSSFFPPSYFLQNPISINKSLIH